MILYFSYFPECRNRRGLAPQIITADRRRKHVGGGRIDPMARSVRRDLRQMPGSGLKMGCLHDDEAAY